MDDEAGTEALIGFVVFTVMAIGVAAISLLRVLPAAERKVGAPFALGVAAAVARRDPQLGLGIPHAV